MRRAAAHRSRSSCLALPAAAPRRRRPRPLRAKLVGVPERAGAVERTATFVGSMPAVAGTKRMWMRFDLFERVAPATDFAAVKAPKLGVWQKSAPGRASSGFVFTQRVQGLTAPASFRAQVRFRWYGKGRQAAALGHAHERDLQAARPAPGPARRRPRRRPRPAARSGHLRARRPQRRPHGGRRIRRRARPSAAPSSRPSTWPASRRRRTTTVTFVAPRCAPGSTLRFELDAEDAVESRARSTTSSSAPARSARRRWGVAATLD